MVAVAQALTLRPVTITEARGFVARRHRHNRPPVGGLFAVGAQSDGELVGVAIIGRPIARLLDDGATCEVTRCCTDGTPNACSMLYGAAARAAKALGYARIVTYILECETGVSLKATGWVKDADVKSEESWSRPARPRMQTDLFGTESRPSVAKTRWVKRLS